jgi:hypothetical protein
MKRIIFSVSTIGISGLAAGALGLSGAGIAAADDYAGQTYADAVAAVEESGSTAVVGSKFGAQLPLDECIVTNSSTQSFVRPMTTDVYFETVGSEVRLNLNCSGGYASATNPGASLASPAGREAKAAAEEAAAAEEQQLAEVSTPGE